MKFPERLKTLREESGFTQQHLAEVLNLTSGAVSHYENGTNEPTIETLIRIADILNVSVDYLVGNADANLPPNEMKKPYCKGISTDSLIQRAIHLDQCHRQELNYFLKCVELEQFISNNGSKGKRS